MGTMKGKVIVPAIIALLHVLALGQEDIAEPTALLAGHGDWVNSVAFSPDGAILISGGHDSTIRLWDVAEQKELAVLEDHTERVRSGRL